MQPSLFDTKAIRKKYEGIFDESYGNLNEEQKSAVNIIEGPVMVIAGPGTGKTQILAMRIGKILKETDAGPHNILCLTYTDAASISMRNRLVQIIGPDAHRVHIHTFHSFCNQVIQENLGLFGNHRQLEPITDLERVDVFKRIMHELPDDHRLKRLKGDPKYEITRMENLFSLMKKESYDALFIDKAATRFLLDQKENPKMYYTRSGKGFSKGDFKKAEYSKTEQKMEDLRAGAHLFEKYRAIMEELGRYDYDDMIIWVLKAFESDNELLLQYQERYQYFLIDEFQDTNGSQKSLLDLLIKFWLESPNVFVVGDDDQAIYKFQGANLDNIKKFRKKYNPELVVLVKNYRSSQDILDAAMSLINFNNERIVKEPDFGLDKKLIASSQINGHKTHVSINSYANNIHEHAAIVSLLEESYTNGEDLGNIAIIYRNHRQVEKLVEVLEKRNIPLNVRRKVDILKIPLVQNIINILEYINASYENLGYTDKLLFEIMHYNFFRIKSHDISALIWHIRTLNEKNHVSTDSGRTKLGQLIANQTKLNELDLISTKQISHLNDLLDKWISDVSNVTLQVLFQNIINEGHILNYILTHQDKSWLLQVLGTLFDLIKDETTKKPDLELKEFLGMIDKMKENNIPLAINKVVSSDRGVHLLTAHSSKGLEFDQVIILGATKNIWDSTRGSNRHYMYPPLMKGDNDLNIEDERRLMYVAMTRAKSKLDICYGLAREDGKELGASQFVDELISATDIKVELRKVAEEDVVNYQYNVLLNQKKPVDLIDHDLIERTLQGYRLSVTGLNKYLKCPITFYFEGILRVPMARTKYLGFGRGIHYALENYHRDLNENKQPGKDSLVSHFRTGMSHHRAHFTKQEYRDMTVYGEQVLSKYFDQNLIDRDTEIKRFELEVKIDHAEYEGIPIKGVLDKVAIGASGVTVTDYKTGNPKSAYTKPKLSRPSVKKPDGGDYWRQIVFYKILLNSDRKFNWEMTTGIIDFVEPEKKTDQFINHRYFVSGHDIDIVGNQIAKVWSNIQAHNFTPGCGEDDCHWCNFVKNDYVMSDTQIPQDAFDAIEI